MGVIYLTLTYVSGREGTHHCNHDTKEQVFKGGCYMMRKAQLTKMTKATTAITTTAMTVKSSDMFSVGTKLYVKII